MVSLMDLSKEPCPCGSSRSYAKCCGIWHAGTPPPDAESLMRSRYCAFVLCNEPYLLATWHPTKRPRSIPFSQSQKWLGLRIVEAKVTGEATAEVEFIARSRISNAAAVRHHERSRFVREAGAWLYVDGDVTR
jgi:SEC-C motif domain protein